MLRLVLCWCRYADTQEEKARKLAKKALVPPASHSPFDLLQSIAAGHYQMIDGMHPGLPAGFTAFSASGVPDGNGKCSHTRGSAAFLLLCTLHVAVESAYKSCIWMLMLTAKHPCMSSSTTHSTSGLDAVQTGYKHVVSVLFYSRHCMKSFLYTLNVSSPIKANAVFLTQNASLNLRLCLPC